MIVGREGWTIADEVCWRKSVPPWVDDGGLSFAAGRQKSYIAYWPVEHSVVKWSRSKSDRSCNSLWLKFISMANAAI